MKSYTDLEQSKKLAEFLPLKSADMWYWEFPTAPTYNDYGYPMFHKGEDIRNVPCWSLAVLFEFIPNVEIKGKVQNFDSKSWCISSHDDKDYNHIWVCNDELIDACYEMIIKLKEQNLL